MARATREDDPARRRNDRNQRRSDVLSCIFGIMKAYDDKGELPEGFKEAVGEKCVEFDVDQGKHWQE